MKKNFVRAALICIALALSTTVAMATNDPIPGVDIIVEKNPGGSVVIQTHTDANGSLTLRGLAPGDYVIEFGGKSLVATMDRLVPPAPVKKSSGSSFSLGIGGMFGGGSSRSNEGKGPVGGERNSGRVTGIAVDPNDPSGNRMNNGGNSSGGVGLGINIPIGGDGNSGSGGVNAPIISMTLTVSGTPGGSRGTDARESSFLSQTPYCRDTAGQGMKFGFKIADNESPRPQDRVFYTVTIDWGDGSAAVQPISDQGQTGADTTNR